MIEDTVINFDLGPSTSNITTMSQIQKWLADCLEFHHRCRALKDSCYMPTRVLEISDADTAEAPPQFRLVDGTNCPSSSSYMTLSYCWGSRPADRVYRLLSSTESKLRTKQSISILPKTLRQAVEAAKCLGSLYLWIDRLCILQDSTEDWLRESARMTDVYKNASLSIAALGSSDDQDGLFWDREPSRMVPSVMNIRTEKESEICAFVDHIDVLKLEVRWEHEGFQEEAPLLSRAWVVQERILSPRVVYMGRKQVFWECSLARYCEMLPGVPNTIEESLAQYQPENDMQSYAWKHHIGKSKVRHKAGDVYEQLFQGWNDIVESYTKCNLTKASDKLVAISGLANDMRTKLAALRPGPHRYLAGLWEQNLPGDLVWSSSSPSTCRRAPEYRAPSWSWASLDGPLEMTRPSRPRRRGGKPHITFASVVTCGTEPADEMDLDTGQVSAGIITLTGPSVLSDLDIQIHSRRTEDLNKALLEALPPGMDRVRVWLDTYDSASDKIFDLIIRGELYDIFSWTCKGLALVRDGQNANVYRRVGMIEYRFGRRADMLEYVWECSTKQFTII